MKDVYLQVEGCQWGQWSTLKCMLEIVRQQRAGLTQEQKSAVSPRPSLPAALTVPGQSGTFWFTSDPAAVWPEDDRVSFKTIIGAVWPVIRHCSPAGLRARPGHRLKCACLLPPQWQPNGPCLLASSMSSSAVYCRTCTSPLDSAPLALFLAYLTIRALFHCNSAERCWSRGSAKGIANDRYLRVARASYPTGSESPAPA